MKCMFDCNLHDLGESVCCQTLFDSTWEGSQSSSYTYQSVSCNYLHNTAEESDITSGGAAGVHALLSAFFTLVFDMIFDFNPTPASPPAPPPPLHLSIPQQKAQNVLLNVPVPSSSDGRTDGRTDHGGAGDALRFHSSISLA